MTSKLLTLAAAAALLLTLGACSSSPTASPSSPTASASADGECAGVSVIVDAGDLAAADEVSSETCVPADAAVLAADAFADAGVETVGTTQYPDDIVCRVNGSPAADEVLTSDDGTAYTETCETMPAAFAYWSLWVKPADGEWGYATEGASTLSLEPGDSVELLFTLNGEPAAPTP